jgi:hypothetical protein
MHSINKPALCAPMLNSRVEALSELIQRYRCQLWENLNPHYGQRHRYQLIFIVYIINGDARAKHEIALLVCGDVETDKFEIQLKF